MKTYSNDIKRQRNEEKENEWADIGIHNKYLKTYVLECTVKATVDALDTSDFHICKTPTDFYPDRKYHHCHLP